MKYIYKNTYKPRYKMWFIINGLVSVADGLFDILLWPFGYRSGVIVVWAHYNLSLDVKRMKEIRNARRTGKH